MKVLEEIYREAGDKILKYIFRLSGNSHMAEEVLQETFYRAIEHLMVSKEEINIAWFYTVSRNIYFDSLRKQKKVTTMDYIEVEDERPSSMPEEVFLKKLEGIEVQNTLEKINDTYKKILILREFKELSYEDIGKEMSMNLNQVKVTLHRARIKFKEMYERGENS